MQVVDLPVHAIISAEWSPNEMDVGMRCHLRQSIRRFGLMVPLVVRPSGDERYETVGGAQRLSVLTDLGVATVPCVVVDLDDVHARLLAQALNRIHGEDDLGLKAELVREVLESLPEQEMLDLLPETAESLRALAALGEADLAEHLQAWERAQGARLKHMIFQLTGEQLEVVTRALERLMAGVTKGGSNPNRRGNALYQMCREYLERSDLS